MKRYVCTVAAGMLLALASAGTATAGLPLLGNSQQGTQSSSFGDQTVGEQKNDADVNQHQGNGNINVSPAIALFGDARTSNHQGNGNTAIANVDQSNTARQSQSSSQSQSLGQGGSQGRCCGGGRSQTGTQETTFGDQTVGEQKNDAEVNQSQGNGNINISPAIAIGGDASTWNAQGNGNTARADVDQSNTASQSQSARQSQNLGQGGGGCCKPRHGWRPPEDDCGPAPKGELKGHGSAPCRVEDRPGGGKVECCRGEVQVGEQSASFGDQTVEKQKNDAEVNQHQGNGNANVSPAGATGGKQNSCRSTCGEHWKPFGADASTWNAQGNGNLAQAGVDQGNTVDQSQGASQSQSLVQGGEGVNLN